MPGNSSTHAGENFRLRGKKLQFARAETSAVDGDSTTDDDNYTNDDGIRTNDGEARRNYAAKQKFQHRRTEVSIRPNRKTNTTARENTMRRIYRKGIKKGVPPYSNLVNLKSNTMKNTLQKYRISRKCKQSAL